MDHLYGLKDCFAAEIVPTPFDCRSLDEVYRPAEYPGQLFLHAPEVEERMTGCRVKSHQHIYVAVLSKVVA